VRGWNGLGWNQKEITRRGFIGKIGQGLVASQVAGTLLKDASAELVVPDPPGKKLGWTLSDWAVCPSIRFCPPFPNARNQSGGIRKRAS
jgi:hypothetical protein